MPRRVDAVARGPLCAAGALLATALIACTGGGSNDKTGSSVAGGGGGTAGAAGTGAAAGTAGQGAAGGSAGGTGGTGQSAGTGGGLGGSGGGLGGSGGAGLGGSGGVGLGGSGGAGGGTPPAPGLTDLSTYTIVSCSISATVTPASAIPMVGIATFTTDLAGAERAVIQFGKTAAYTLEAPVDWAADSHRTLLLGMPADTTVNYRVVVIQGRNACVSADATYLTGTVNGAPPNVIPTKGTSTVAPAPGFIIAENQSFAFIVNSQGEVVWAYKFPVNVVRALMSFDGRYMYARDGGPVVADSGGSVYRVAMDGSGERLLTLSGGNHHDLAVTPAGIAYIAKRASNECDSIYLADPDGSNSRMLVDLGALLMKFPYGESAYSFEKCHVNAIRYYKDTDSFSLSDREKDVIVFFSGKGEALGSIGSQPREPTPNHAKAEGADSKAVSPWRVQHGHDWYAPDKIVVFSNGIFEGGTSRLLHYTIDGATAKLDWQYTGAGNSNILGDAQHLPNGNFLATSSRSGAVHEIDPSQKLVQSFTGLSRAYTCHRPTLYGPPPGR